MLKNNSERTPFERFTATSLEVRLLLGVGHITKLQSRLHRHFHVKKQTICT